MQSCHHDPHAVHHILAAVPAGPDSVPNLKLCTVLDATLALLNQDAPGDVKITDKKSDTAMLTAVVSSFICRLMSKCRQVKSVSMWFSAQSAQNTVAATVKEENG